MNNNFSEYIEKAEEKALEYLNKYKKYAFDPSLDCYNSKASYEGSIRRWTHIVQKGLSMSNYNYGSGRKAYDSLVELLLSYSKEYGISEGFYEEGLNAAEEYLKKNAYIINDYQELRKKLDSIPGKRINEKAVLKYESKPKTEYRQMNYEEMVKDRHSIRHFSDKELVLEDVLYAVELADYSPSACNRKGWTTYIITNRDRINEVLRYQNGNKGFGEEIKILALITYDLHFCNLDRELFQAYIDGGLYAMNLMNALHSEGIAVVPLSASLHKEQEEEVRRILNIDDSEVFILFLGMGNYSDSNLVTKNSKRNSVKVIGD